MMPMSKKGSSDVLSHSSGGYGDKDKITPYKIDRSDDPWPSQEFPGDTTKIDVLPDPWPEPVPREKSNKIGDEE